MRRSDNGCPMPPPAPRTATFVCLAADEEKVRELADKARTAERASIIDVVVVVVEQDVEDRWELSALSKFQFMRKHRKMPSGSEWLGREFTHYQSGIRGRHKMIVVSVVCVRKGQDEICYFLPTGYACFYVCRTGMNRSSSIYQLVVSRDHR